MGRHHDTNVFGQDLTPDRRREGPVECQDDSDILSAVNKDDTEEAVKLDMDYDFSFDRQHQSPKAAPSYNSLISPPPHTNHSHYSHHHQAHQAHQGHQMHQQLQQQVQNQVQHQAQQVQQVQPATQHVYS